MFDAVKSKYNDITFTRVNIDDHSNDDLVERHQAKSIPRLVFVDGGGKELSNHVPSMSPEALVQEINQYH